MKSMPLPLSVITPLPKLQRIRPYQYQSSVGYGVTKNWYTVMDDKVRETHRYLEGASVSLDEEFWTFDGDHAAYPGGFTKAENNVNCRCTVELHIDAEEE